MELVNLTIEPRKIHGSNGIRRLRGEGAVPGVVYSKGSAAIPVQLDGLDLFRATKDASGTQLFQFKSEDSTLDGLMVLIKQTQIDPLKDKVLHVDFQALQKGESLSVTVEVEIVGECLAVKQKRAILNQMLHEVELECLPSKIPEILRVDVSALEVGETLYASDISTEEGVTLKTDPRSPVVSAAAPKEEKEEPEAAEGEATEETKAAG